LRLVVAPITPERTRPTDRRRLTLLTPSCADHRTEHEEKHDPEGHSLATRRKERSEIDGHRRIREGATTSATMTILLNLTHVTMARFDYRQALPQPSGSLKP
jgi:hypothetical protein